MFNYNVKFQKLKKGEKTLKKTYGWNGRRGGKNDLSTSRSKILFSMRGSEKEKGDTHIIGKTTEKENKDSLSLRLC